jgi:transmembrane sensor
MAQGESDKDLETREDAAEFVVEGKSSPLQEERLLDWLSDSPENVSEYLRMSTVWEALGDPELTNLGQPRVWHRPAWKSRQVITMALAAALILAVGWVTWSARTNATHSTAVGEVASFQLEDGSVVFMNADSELSVDYSPEKRQVLLLFGDASFEVSEDPQRPFIVKSGPTRVIAVGTEFVVRRISSKTTVTVLEGHVVVEGDFDLAPSNASAADLGAPVTLRGLPLGPQQQLEIDDSRHASLTKVDTDVAVAWRRRRLIFDSDRLEAVVTEFNRFNTRAIYIEDQDLKDLRISGVFEANDPESLLDFLQFSKGATVDVRADGTTRVGPRTDAPH